MRGVSEKTRGSEVAPWGSWDRLRRLLLLALGWFPALGIAVARPPNILILLTDDHGYGDLSTYQASDCQTPHLDRLAREGMLFRQMRSNATVCSPARAALLTGRYPDRAGVPGVIRTHAEDSWGYFSPEIPTLADLLGRHGYHTALVGKWHLGLESPNTPGERGFDHFHGFLGDMMDSYTDHRRHGINYLRLNETPIEPSGHATDLFAEFAVEYLHRRAEADEPFFLYLAFNAPHFPIEPPPAWLDRVAARAPQLDPLRARNVAFVEHTDDAIGRVLRALDDTGLAAHTIVAMSADNGGSLPHQQSNAPWRGGKQSHYDGGLRVPFMIRWPGEIVPGSSSDYPGLLFDLFPTMLAVAGIDAPAGIDAVSLLPILRGGELPMDRELYFVRREGGPRYGGNAYHALIRGRWKLLQNSPGGELELYQLEEDPHEQTNLSKKHPAIVTELAAAMSRHIQAGGRVPWQPPDAP